MWSNWTVCVKVKDRESMSIKVFGGIWFYWPSRGQISIQHVIRMVCNHDSSMCCFRLSSSSSSSSSESEPGSEGEDNDDDGDGDDKESEGKKAEHAEEARPATERGEKTPSPGYKQASIMKMSHGTLSTLVPEVRPKVLFFSLRLLILRQWQGEALNSEVD